MRWLTATALFVALSVQATEYSRETARFSLRTDGQTARALDKSGTLQGAQLATLCQRALLLPHQSELRERLAERVGLVIPDSVSFSTARIDGFRHQQSGSEVACTGQVNPTDPHGDLQETALRALWAVRPDPESADFDRLLAVIDDRRDMDDDVLVYIASFMPPADAAALLSDIEPSALKASGARQLMARLGL